MKVALALSYAALCGVTCYVLKPTGIAYLAFLVVIAGVGVGLGRAMVWAEDTFTWR